MLLAVDPDEDFIYVEGIAVASMPSLQAAGINGTQLDTPEPDRFAGDSNAALGQ